MKILRMTSSYGGSTLLWTPPDQAAGVFTASAVEILDFLGARRVAQLADGLVLDLADALTRDAEDLADFLQRVRPAEIGRAHV